VVSLNDDKVVGNSAGSNVQVGLQTFPILLEICLGLLPLLCGKIVLQVANVRIAVEDPGLQDLLINVALRRPHRGGNYEDVPVLRLHPLRGGILGTLVHVMCDHETLDALLEDLAAVAAHDVRGWNFTCLGSLKDVPLPEDLGTILSCTHKVGSRESMKEEKRIEREKKGKGVTYNLQVMKEVDHMAVNNVKLGQHLTQRAWGFDSILLGLYQSQKKKKKRSEGRVMKMEEKKNKQTSSHKPIQPASTSSDFSLASTSVFLLAVKAEPSSYSI